MGWQDRDYGNQDTHQRMVRPSMPSTLTGWVMGLVVVGLFVSLASKTAVAYGVLAAGSVVPGAQVWRLATYPWISYGFGDAMSLVINLLFNLALLWMFGRMAESLLTRGRWLLIAVLGPVVGALALEGAWHAAPQAFVSGVAAGPMVIMFALMGASVARTPKQPCGLFFLPMSIELRWVVAFIAGISLLLVVSQSPSGADEFSHLVSFAVGFGLAKLPSAPPVVRGRSISPAYSPFAALRIKLHNWKHHRQAQSHADHRAEVDRILAKIKREGMGKLTAKEKQVLQRDTERLKK